MEAQVSDLGLRRRGRPSTDRTLVFSSGTRWQLDHEFVPTGGGLCIAHGPVIGAVEPRYGILAWWRRPAPWCDQRLPGETPADEDEFFGILEDA